MPLAGQVVSAALGYTAMRTLGELHIKDCVRVAKSVQMVLPSPQAAQQKIDSIKDEARVDRLLRRLRLR